MRTNKIPSIVLAVAEIVGLCETQAFAGCVPSAHYKRRMACGSDTRYVFVVRQIPGKVQLPTPLDNLPADGMASMMAQ